MAQFAAINQSLASSVDETATPRWCMVPAQGSKTVRLVQGDGLKLALAPGATAGIQFTETPGADGRRVEIKAQQAGEATLQAMSGRTVAAALDISVFARKEFAISVRFVYDKGAEVTGRPLSRLGYSQFQDKIGIINNILLPQTNIAVKLLTMGPTHVWDDLSQGFLYRAAEITKAELQSLPSTLSVYRSGRFPRIGCVSGKTPGPEGCDASGLNAVSDPDLRKKLRALDQEFDLFMRTDSNADFTFLAVNKLVQAPDVGAYTEADGCILPDTVPAFSRGFVMAHEFGHFLLGRRPGGQAWHTSDARDLMHPNLATLAADLGFLIRKTEAIQMSKKNPKP